MTTVRITETYDLSTRLNKMGMIGIHTPSTATIKGLYPGLWDSHKFIRFVKCDVSLACASMLPADPLQIGTEAGSIAPQDMFNPILYRAVTNESFDMILGRMNTLLPRATLATGHNTNVSPEVFGNLSQSSQIYYSLLSERGWRKAMPQSGLSIRGLRPLVFPVMNAFGNQLGLSGNGTLNGALPLVDDSGEITTPSNMNAYFRGKARRMPRLPTKSVIQSVSEFAPSDSSLPCTFVACLIMPPSKLHQLYYRLRVSWTISFEGVRSINEYGSISDIHYASGYVYQEYMASSKQEDMEKDDSTVASNDMDMERIMQAGV